MNFIERNFYFRMDVMVFSSWKGAIYKWRAYVQFYANGVDTVESDKLPEIPNNIQLCAVAIS